MAPNGQSRVAAALTERQSPFVWGSNGERMTAEQLKKHRAVTEALMARNSGTPTNLGEGLASVGNALAFVARQGREEEAMRLGRDDYATAFAALGEDPAYETLLAAAPNGFETEAERMIWQAQMQNATRGNDWKTFESAGDVFLFDQNNPDAGPRLFHDGPDAPAKAPTVETRFNPETGLDEKFQWNGAEWVPFGGQKAPSNGLTVTTNPDGTTTVTQGGTGRYGTTVDTGMGEMMTGIQKDAFAAVSGLNTLDAMTEAMADPNFYSGFGAEQIKTLKQAAVAMGIGDPESVTSMESFNALAKQSALDSMGGSLGAGFSNADRSFVEQQVANISSTPEGNRAIMEIQRKMARRKIQIATFADEYAKANGGKLDSGFTTALAQWAETNPLFPASGAAPSGAALPDPFGVR